jgi:hypothetical protein
MVVNGITVFIDGTSFVAVNVPLVAGDNVITAVATNLRGDHASQSVTVTAQPTGPSMLTLTAVPTSGMAPLRVDFTYQLDPSVTAQSLQIDFDGDGVDDFSTDDVTRPLQYEYSTPGIYVARLRVTDNQGTVYEAIVGIQAQAAGDVDACFQALWGGMNSALVAGDKETALQFLSVSAQAKYGPVFDALLPHMPEIVASYSAFRAASFSASFAEYGVTRIINGMNQLFLIDFVRDADGVWRLDAM